MTNEQTPDFPSELLVAESGAILGKSGDYCIIISLRSFTYENESIEDELVIEHLPFVAETPRNLSGQEFSFPPNPEDGYIESSIYMWGVHNPIDVLRIKFGNVEDGWIEATFDMRFVFEYEGLCNNLSKIFTLALNIASD